MRNSPSCGCCETGEFDCLQFRYQDLPNYAAYFDSFTTIDGSFSTGGTSPDPPHHETSAVASIENDELLPADTPWRVFARFEFTPDAGGSSIWRLVGDKVDDDNYLFVDFCFFHQGGDDYSYNVKLGKRETGTDTYIAKLYSDDNYAVEEITGTRVVEGELCYTADGTLNGGTRSSPFSPTDFTMVSKRNVTALGGDKTGIVIGQLNGTLRFEEYEIYLVEGENTTECDDCVLSCADGFIAEEFLLEFDDPTPHDFEYYTTFPNCKGLCAALNGTFTFVEGVFDPATETGNGDASGDAICQWYSGPYEIVADECDTAAKLYWTVHSSRSTESDPASFTLTAIVYRFTPGLVTMIWGIWRFSIWDGVSGTVPMEETIIGDWYDTLVVEVPPGNTTRCTSGFFGSPVPDPDDTIIRFKRNV